MIRGQKSGVRSQVRRWLLVCLLFLISDSWLLSPAQAQCGPDPTPAPAAAHGFNCEVFWDNFTSLSTVDVNNTLAPGYKWYVAVAYGGVTDASVFQQVSGGLQITPDLNGAHPNSSSLYQMASCAIQASGWVGTAVTGGMYIDVKLTTWGPQLGGNNWWPAGWTLGLVQLVGGLPTGQTVNSPELDLREWAGTEARYTHIWQLPASTDIGGQTYVSSTQTFVSPTTYGVLVLKPAQNGGTGTVIGYLNDAVETNSTPVTWSPGGTNSNFSELPMCVLFTSGYNQPVVIRSVGVWQATLPPQGGKLRGRR
jgi:hypothetical protein